VVRLLDLLDSLVRSIDRVAAEADQLRQIPFCLFLLFD